MAQDETDRVYDELLVLLVQSGDRRAMDRLAARWQPRLLATARRLLGSAQQAPDCVQETWAGICKGLPRLSDPARFPAWAFGILHRKCADQIRSEVRRRGRAQPLEEASASAPASPEGARGDLERAFARLSHDHRVAATLYFAEGLSLAEVAEATGVPVGTAKSRIFHARKQLKSLLEGEQDD